MSVARPHGRTGRQARKCVCSTLLTCRTVAARALRIGSRADTTLVLALPFHPGVGARWCA